MLITLSYEDSVISLSSLAIAVERIRIVRLPVFFLKTVARNQVFNFLISIRLRNIYMIVRIIGRVSPFVPEMATLVYLCPLTGSKDELSNFEKKADS